jgi:hypothetical protein
MGHRRSLREVMPSLVNTLPRCHSTVRGLMNSWAAISWLVCPSQASLAMWACSRSVSVRVVGSYYGRPGAWCRFRAHANSQLDDVPVSTTALARGRPSAQC